MRITIDTKTDNPKHIKKAIELLNLIADEGGNPSSSGYTNMFGDNLPSKASTPPGNPMSGLMSIFGGDNTSPAIPSTPVQSHSQSFPPTSSGNETPRLEMYDDFGRSTGILSASRLIDDAGKEEGRLKPTPTKDYDDSVLEYY
mgnify:CR=1 FL=1